MEPPQWIEGKVADGGMSEPTRGRHGTVFDALALPDVSHRGDRSTQVGCATCRAEVRTCASALRWSKAVLGRKSWNPPSEEARHIVASQTEPPESLSAACGRARRGHVGHWPAGSVLRRQRTRRPSTLFDASAPLSRQATARQICARYTHARDPPHATWLVYVVSHLCYTAPNHDLANPGRERGGCACSGGMTRNFSRPRALG